MNDFPPKGTSSDLEFAHTISLGKSVGSPLSGFIGASVSAGSDISTPGRNKAEDAAQFRKQNRIREQILFLGGLNEGWDHRGAPPPSARAVRLAFQILSRGTQYRVLPDAVGPSPDGGIMLEFHAGDRYFLVDVYNDGDIVLLRESECGDTRTTQEDEDGIDRIVFELRDAYGRIR